MGFKGLFVLLASSFLFFKIASAETVAVAVAVATAAPAGLSAEQAVEIAIKNNPQVLSAQAQYQAALRQIEPAYAPQDPQWSYSLSQTPNGFTHAQTRSVGISESAQFPGKALLQGTQAQRDAEIARLTYLAALRDARAQTLTAYYQALLDRACVDIAMENTTSFRQVLEVVNVAYAASQAAQSDLINAEISVAQSSQTIQVSRVAAANDEAALNLAMGRSPDVPVILGDSLGLEPLDVSVDALKAKALAMRQEVLAAILTEKNSQTAVKLAWMEMLPDYNVSWMRNNYPPGSINAEPAAAAGPSHDFSTSLSFNVPVFFWFKQKEDTRAAYSLLDSARDNRKGAELQALAMVVELYRSAQLAYQTALLNKNLLLPLALQGFRVSLVAYQAKKVDFLTLSSALQGVFNARINYLTAVNQFLAGKVALEQAIGAPLK